MLTAVCTRKNSILWVFNGEIVREDKSAFWGFSWAEEIDEEWCRISTGVVECKGFMYVVSHDRQILRYNLRAVAANFAAKRQKPQKQQHNSEVVKEKGSKKEKNQKDTQGLLVEKETVFRGTDHVDVAVYAMYPTIVYTLSLSGKLEKNKVCFQDKVKPELLCSVETIDRKFKSTVAISMTLNRRYLAVSIFKPDDRDPTYTLHLYDASAPRSITLPLLTKRSLQSRKPCRVLRLINSKGISFLAESIPLLGLSLSAISSGKLLPVLSGVMRGETITGMAEYSNGSEHRLYFCSYNIGLKWIKY